jgi:5-formyltetrahydrofolate cyclo-ligase
MYVDIDKAQARKAAFAARKAAFIAVDAAPKMRLANLNLQTVLTAYAGKTLAGYMPMRTEIDPLPAMWGHNGPLCVPVITAAGAPLRFAAYHPGADMETGTFGALVPKEVHFVIPHVLIVPLLAFDRRGYRLGYGGGFYDRTLESLRTGHDIFAVGFAFACQESDMVPIETTDQPLDAVVTETEILQFNL